MSENSNKDYKDLVILAIAAIGISIAWFAYLVYLKDKRSRNKDINSNLSVLSKDIQTDVVPKQLHDNRMYERPVYDERLYQLLENQQMQLENMNSNINGLNNNLNNGLINSLNSLNRAQHNSNIVKPSKAGSITTLRTSNEDKSRQLDFGMN